MKFTERKTRRPPAVIIVSLIDVLLVVLIFLMVTATFQKMEPALQLVLPKSDAAQLDQVDPTAFVVLVATNFPFYYLNNQPISFPSLQKEITAAAQTNPQLRLDIKADKLSPFGKVIQVIDAAKEARVGSINAITEKRTAP